MALPHIPGSLWWLVVPLVAWRLYARLRKLVARQRFSAWRQGANACGLVVLTIALAAAAGIAHSSVFWLGAGWIIGGGLGFRAFRLTQFERRADGLFFTPDRYIGLALSAVLVGRILWRLIAGPSQSTSGWSLDELVRNPSTLFLYGLYAGHFVVYSSGLIFRALPRRERGSVP